ncbi:membrane hypothetical protein [Verrucomicrobia bacterium]|nr:membrane hypothetical protein [Verrucomicrobiota bacterium]
MKKLCDLYVAKAGLIGALYCVIPTLVGFAVMFCVVPFRQVYLYRLAIAVFVGGPVAAYLNRFGLSLWLSKHNSPHGPATVLDGALIGWFLGMAMAVIPAFTHFIASNGMDGTKTIVIAIWFIAGIIGAIIGGSLGFVGAKYLDRRPGG